MDCIEETEAAVAVVTETWYKEGGRLEEEKEYIAETAGLEMVTKNRQALENGVAYGGVAVLWKSNAIKFKEIEMKNPDTFEILACVGTVRGHSRKLIVVACYLPPNYDKKRGAQALSYITDSLIWLKRKFKDPYLVVAGDFNQWEVDVSDLADVQEVKVGPTRHSKSIDRVFLNFPRKVEAYGTLAPLETDDPEDPKKSDHRIAYVAFKIEKREVYRWEEYTYRHYNNEAVEKFKAWIVMHEWGEVLEARGAEEKATAYQRVVNGAIERCFPLKKRKKKSTDLPWMTRGIKKQIKRRREIYCEEGGGSGRTSGRRRRKSRPSS